MRPPYIFLILLIFATSLGASGCSLMEHFRNPNSLARRVGNFSPTKLDSDRAEMESAKKVTPLIRGSRDLDGRQEQFDPAFGAPETEAELDEDRAHMNAVRFTHSRPTTPVNGDYGAGFSSPDAGSPAPGTASYGTSAAANIGGTATGGSFGAMNTSAGAQFGKPAGGIGTSSAARTGSAQLANPQSSGGTQFGKSGNETASQIVPTTGFAGKGSQFGSPNTANSLAAQRSSGKLNSTSSGMQNGSASLGMELSAGRTRNSNGSSPPAKQSSVAIVQTPDSSRFGLAHGNVKPTTFAQNVEQVALR